MHRDLLRRVIRGRRNLHQRSMRRFFLRRRHGRGVILVHPRLSPDDRSGCSLTYLHENLLEAAAQQFPNLRDNVLGVKCPFHPTSGQPYVLPLKGAKTVRTISLKSSQSDHL